MATMQAFRKLVAIYLGVVGVGTAAQFVLQNFYDSTDALSDGWRIISWLMAVALVLMLAIVGHESRAAGHDPGAPVTRSWLTAKASLYATAFFALLFFWNWFTWEWGRSGVEHDLQYWRLIDTGVAILAISTALRAWRAGPAES
ncbi:MAG: hypothetical protein OXH07_08275 [Chloroflexi bacterium]|nr:hypothetical protein [Chloroflexota bacterium]